MSEEELKETITRLNRRCQRLEHLVAKWRRRYASIQKPAKEALEQAHRLAKLMHDLYYGMRKKTCWWCGR